MNNSIPQASARASRPSGRPRKVDAWVRASKVDRLSSAAACFLGSLSFAGPGQWLSGRAVRGSLWFVGELLLVGLWLLVAADTAGWQMLGMTGALAVYHLINWVDAARCGWLFRKVTIQHSFVRIAVMAGVIAAAPLPAGILVFGLAKEFLIAEYEISEGSMATALLGQHARVICRACGYEFTLGLLNPQTDFGLPENLNCPMCGKHNFRLINSASPPRDRILLSKTLSLRRWDLLMFRSPANMTTLFLKRVVGLPGEELQIIDGDIFINGSRISKPALAHEEMWLKILDTNFQDKDSTNPKLRWQPRRSALGWQTQRRNWLFDSANNRAELLELTGELTDELAYNVHTMQYIEPRAIHDVRLSVQLSQLQGQGPLSLLWQHSGREVRGSIDAKGAAKLVVQRTGQQQPEIVKIAHLGRPVATGLKLILIIRDGLAYLYADGKELCQAAIGPIEAKAVRQKMPQSCQLSIVASNCRGRISRIQLDRDVHYQAISARTRQPARTAAVKIQPGHYYVLGDNSAVSSDSRLGWQIHLSLQGKIQPGMVPTELTEGVVTSIYWPPTRWRTFR